MATAVADHPLHFQIGAKLRDIKYPEGTKQYMQSRCGSPDKCTEIGDLPLFTSVPNEDDTEVWQRLLMVHTFVTVNEKIAVMGKHDATGISANQLCGRFLSAAISPYHQKGGAKIPEGDPLLYIQVIPDVLPRKFKEYLADTFIKMVVPSKTTRECDYALYRGGFGDFEGYHQQATGAAHPGPP